MATQVAAVEKRKRGRPRGAKGKPQPKPPINVSEVLAKPTCTVPIAARVIGLNGTGYAEAQRGEIPVLRFGRRMLVPTAWLKRVINGDMTLHKSDGEARA